MKLRLRYDGYYSNYVIEKLEPQAIIACYADDNWTFVDCYCNKEDAITQYDYMLIRYKTENVILREDEV